MNNKIKKKVLVSKGNNYWMEGATYRWQKIFSRYSSNMELKIHNT
jgi:hypothetical protein